MRGRKPEPLEIGALKGNARAAARLKRVQAFERGEHPSPTLFEPPAFLTGETEREAFARALRLPLVRRVVGHDVHVLARWAFFLAVWAKAKARFDRSGGKTHVVVKSAHVTRHVRSPDYVTLLEVDRTLAALEAVLGLSPTSRQHIIRDLLPIGPTVAAEPREDDEERPKSNRLGQTRALGLELNIGGTMARQSTRKPPSSRRRPSRKPSRSRLRSRREPHVIRPTAAAARMRAYRDRARRGRRVVGVTIDDVAVPMMLIEAGLLSTADVDDADAIAEAIGRMLEVAALERDA